MSFKPQLSPVGLAATVPWVSLGLLAGFAALAYAQVGHWPSYGQPDPKDVALAWWPGVRIGRAFLPLMFLALLASLAAISAVSFFLMCTLAENRWSLRHELSSRAFVHFGVSGFGFLVFLVALHYHANWLLD